MTTSKIDNTVPAPVRNPNYTRIFIVIVLGVLLTLWALSAMVDAGEPRPVAKPDALHAYAMSQVFVQQQLKAPSTAEFARMSQATITDLGGGRWRVTAYVDSENGYGAMLRLSYTAVLKWTGGDKWLLESVVFDE